MRRAAQVFVFALMFLIPLANIHEIYAVTGTFYAVNILGLSIADPSAITQSIFAAAKVTIPLLFAALFPIILALLFGRIWCGWMCPYLLVSDLVARARQKFASIIGKSGNKGLPVGKSMKANLYRFGFLIMGTALAGAISVPALNYVNAPGILSTEAMILVKQGLFSVEIIFIAALMGLELTILPRFYCRLFCPTGSVVSLFRIRLTMRVANKGRISEAPCCRENFCSRVCPMGLEPFHEGDDLLCVNCGLCIAACKSNRLKFQGFKS
jgi:ferredoxin-type protein NapH